MCPVSRRRRGLRRDLNGSALPTLPQSVSRGARFSRLHWFAFATACQVARPPGRIGPSFPGPPGAFTSRLPAGRSPFPPLDMTTTATGLLCWRDFHPQEWQLASLHRIKTGMPRPGGPPRLILLGRIRESVPARELADRILQRPEPIILEPSHALGIRQGPSKIPAKAVVAHDHGINQAAPKGLADNTGECLKAEESYGQHPAAPHKALMLRLQR